MFCNIYLKRIRAALRDPTTLVWTWVFPLMMATLFYFAFGSLDETAQLQTVPVAVVRDSAYPQDQTLQTALQQVSQGDSALLSITYVDSTQQADTLLQNEKVSGYILAGDVPQLAVSGSGIEQTVLRGFLDSYQQTKNTVSRAVAAGVSDPQQLRALIARQDFTEGISLTKNPVTEKVGYFYALLAMVCLYGSFQGLTSVDRLQANLSPVGARQTMAPTNRHILVSADLLGGITVHAACVGIVVLYIRYVLGVDFGGKMPLVLLTCLVGSLVGVAFGALVSVNHRIKDGPKTAILISVIMVLSFLSGLMVSGINYTVAQKLPVVSWLNPAARISDAFYCLYCYDGYSQYFLNIGILLAMAAVMFAATAAFVRRQRYESI